ncbi:hypothetical protein P7C70_g5058, partial [Phenoliferia sp. Uapishka_3]
MLASTQTLLVLAFAAVSALGAPALEARTPPPAFTCTAPTVNRKFTIQAYTDHTLSISPTTSGSTVHFQTAKAAGTNFFSGADASGSQIQVADHITPRSAPECFSAANRNQALGQDICGGNAPTAQKVRRASFLAPFWASKHIDADCVSGSVIGSKCEIISKASGQCLQQHGASKDVTMGNCDPHGGISQQLFNIVSY